MMSDLQGGLLALEHYYEVGGRSGRWEFGERYGAMQRPLARPVGLWVLSGLMEMGVGEGLLERVKRAVWRASRLGRPEHLQILDYGQLEDRSPFIVTERVEGMATLKDLIVDRGPLTLGRTLGVIGKLVVALNDAYQQAIFHGGLHTGCVWLRGEDEVKLSGYGLGLSRTDLFSLNQAMFSTDLVRHLPPEAFEGGVFDLNERGESPGAMGEALAVDVYGLGCIAYECLTGMHPYFSDERGAADGVLAMMRETPHSLSEHFGLPRELDEVISRAINRDPSERFANPSAFLKAFDEAIPESMREHNTLNTRPSADTARAPLIDWFLAFLDLAPLRLRLWANRPATRRALVGLLIVTNIVTLLSLLHITQTNPSNTTSKIAFTPPAPPGSGVDLMLLPLHDQPTAQLHMVSQQGDAAPLGPLPFLLRDQQPGARLTFLVTSPSGGSTQIQVVVREANDQRWMAIDPNLWRTPSDPPSNTPSAPTLAAPHAALGPPGF